MDRNLAYLWKLRVSAYDAAQEIEILSASQIWAKKHQHGRNQGTMSIQKPTPTNSNCVRFQSNNEFSTVHSFSSKQILTVYLARGEGRKSLAKPQSRRELHTQTFPRARTIMKSLTPSGDTLGLHTPTRVFVCFLAVYF